MVGTRGVNVVVTLLSVVVSGIFVVVGSLLSCSFPPNDPTVVNTGWAADVSV